MGASVPWGVVLGCALIAEVVGTLAGFGSATILTPIAALFMDVKTAIAIVACFHLFGSASRLFFFRQHVHRTIWWQFGVTGVLCSFVGAAVAARLPSAAVKLSFGVFLLVYVVLSTLPWQPVRLSGGPVTLFGGGVLSGFIAGLLGTGGAIRSACLLVFDLPKEIYIGTSAAIALLVDATRLPVYLTERFIPPAWLPMVIGLVGVAFTGAWVGQRLVQRVSPVAFRRFVMVMLALIGVKMLVEGWHGLG